MTTLGTLSPEMRNRGLAALSVIRAAGFKDERTALQVAYAESGWNQAARNKNRNGSIDYGLFQINSVHNPSNEVKTNALANARFAKSLVDKQGWKPWATWNSGKARSGEAVAVTNSLLKDVPKGSSTPQDGQDGGILGAAEGLAKDAAGSALGTAGTVSDALNAANPLNALDTVKAGLDGFIAWAQEALTTLLMVLIGLVLFALGMYAAFHEQINGAAGAVASGAVKLFAGKKVKAAATVAKAIT